MEAKDSSIYVLGDVMVDEYKFYKATRLSPEGPVPVCKLVKEESRLGGAGNVAANVRAILKNNKHEKTNVHLYGVVGIGDRCEIARYAVDADLICRVYACNVWTTIRKRRPVTEDGHMFFREDIECDDPRALDSATRIAMIGDLSGRLWKENVLVISDYGKGSIPDEMFNGGFQTPCPTLVNCKPDRIEKYGSVEALVLNQSEAREYLAGTSERAATLAASVLNRIVENCGERSRPENVIVTCGHDGMFWYNAQSKATEHIPALAVGVVDVTGAGDTVIATMAACWPEYQGVHRKMLEEATYNASRVVGCVGTSVPKPRWHASIDWGHEQSYDASVPLI